MAGCPKCGFENPAESRFCARCGAPLPVAGKCPGCGAENPPGSRFCKQCGRSLTDATSGGGSTNGGLGGGPGGRSDDLHTVKVLLWVAIAVIAYAAFLNYSSMETMQAYMGPYADTSTSTFLLVLDGVLAGLSGFAAVQLEQGETGMAKNALLANAVVGGLALFLFHGSLQEIMLNGGLLTIGIWGLRLLNKGRRKLI
ncbi:MAG: zinc ribbon domain-containing protein [Thiobacillus sp.]|nr:zinc ribbon domain-containing protein [Thiobacillus sp.]